MPGSAAPVLKIGLIAPFEGLGRPLGYAILPAVQEAIAAANSDMGPGGYRLLLVALNDDLDPEVAAAQAAALAQDPAVIAVIGPFTTPTAARVAPGLADAGIPTLVAAPLDLAPDGVFPLCPAPETIFREADRAARGIYNASCSEKVIDEGAIVCASGSGVATLPEADVATEPGHPAWAYWPGGAAEAADWLATDGGAAFVGALFGGPDLLKPWFVGRAGEMAEATRALACSQGGPVRDDATLPEVALARAGAERIVRAAAANAQSGHPPTRAGVAAALSAQQFEPGLVWYEVSGGAWRRVE